MNQQKTEDREIIYDLLRKDEKRVLEILCNDHQGVYKAISLNDLTEKAGVSSVKRLQEIIYELVEIYGVRIGWEMSAGYFIINDEGFEEEPNDLIISYESGDQSFDDTEIQMDISIGVE
jgi:hypothetical protein